MVSLKFSHFLSESTITSNSIRKLPKTRARNASKMADSTRVETVNSVIHSNTNHHVMTFPFLISSPMALPSIHGLPTLPRSRSHIHLYQHVCAQCAARFMQPGKVYAADAIAFTQLHSRRCIHATLTLIQKHSHSTYAAAFMQKHLCCRVHTTALFCRSHAAVLVSLLSRCYLNAAAFTQLYARCTMQQHSRTQHLCSIHAPALMLVQLLSRCLIQVYAAPRTQQHYL